jgi:hypothetical protein
MVFEPMSGLFPELFKKMLEKALFFSQNSHLTEVSVSACHSPYAFFCVCNRRTAIGAEGV